MAEPKNSMINDMKATDSASRETIQNIDLPPNVTSN